MTIHQKLLLPVLSLLLFVIRPVSKPASVSSFDTIKVDGGHISGTVNSAGDVHIFKGIPFAAPPVGTLRWKEPQPVKPWTGVKKCDTFSASPMQNKPVSFMMYTPEFLIPEKPISEDCLYLNVWTAAKTSNEKRPVIVWIYGGGFVSGGSAAGFMMVRNWQRRESCSYPSIIVLECSGF